MSEVATIDQKPVAAPATPAALLQIAVENGSSVDHLEKLMSMQLQWEANEARKAFVAAMSAFRAEAPVIEKSTQGHNYVYATLESITAKVNPILSKHGLSFGWVTEQGDRITVHCDVTHVLGHSQRVSLSGSPDTTGSKNDIQAIGSTVSYLQRYTLLSALGLATGGMDNDGEASSDYKRINPDQLASINKMVSNHGLADEFDDWLKRNGIEDRADIPAANYGSAINQINGLRKAKNGNA